MKHLVVTAVLAVMLTACQTANPASQTTSPVAHVPTGQTLTTPSGLSYKVIKQGMGKSVGVNDDVEIRFTSYDKSGAVLDKSNTPVILRPSDMFAGLQEGLTLMQQGGVYELYIPANLGYSDDENLVKRPITYHVEVLRLNP